MLSLTDVAVQYGSLMALDGVSLELGPHERLAVLGPSGSGKSTLLRAIAGLEPLAHGTVSWDGQDMVNVATHERGFGLMFQDYALFPHLDVTANVAFGLRMRGLPRAAAAEAATEALARVGLAGFGRRSVAQLSGGEQQRVALARALAPEPRLLMLDEPLGALDRGLREELLGQLTDLVAELRLPTIYVTHDQQEALAVGERVAVMRAGRLEAIMPAPDLWQSPPTEFVARFLGFANITSFGIGDDGRAVTPWGSLELVGQPPPGADRLLIRPDGLRLDPAGTITGHVAARSFRGDRTILSVSTGADAPLLEVDLRVGAPPAVGDAVSLRLEPNSLRFLKAG